MIKRGFILLFLLMNLFSLYNIANAQTYSLRSFEGTKVQVKLSYKPSIGTLAITCIKDTMYLVDYMDIDNIKIVSGKFLQITYAKRAGSNEDLMNILLLCVDHSKLVQAVHFKSFFEYDMRNIDHIKGNLSEYQLFKLSLQLTGSSKSNYKLNVNIHDESSSERTPRSNHNYNKQIVLNFDLKQNIFYNANENISKSFTIYDPKTQDQIIQAVNGIIPVITISKVITTI